MPLLLAPVSGPMVPIEEVPDPVFAQKIVGDGVSIDPVTSTLRAPCDSEVLFVHPSGHAVNLKTEDGLELVLHIGLETVGLRGEGFLPHVKAGDRVKAGDPLVDFAPDYVATTASSLLTQLVVATPERVQKLTPARGYVEAGRDPVIELTLVDGAERREAIAGGGARLSRDLIVRNPTGLHARPAAMLASTARRFKADVRLRRGDNEANAKSLTAIMALELALNDRIALSAAGADAQQALDTLVPLIEAGLGEAPAPAAGIPAAAVPVSRAVSPAAIPIETPPAPSGDPNVLRGSGASPGLAIGRVFQWRPQDIPVAQATGDPAEERLRLERALAAARGQLGRLRDQISKTHAAEATIFAAHLELLEDPDLVDFCFELIAGGAGAAAAWHRAFTRLADRLAAARSELYAGRAADVRDVGRRVLRLLASGEGATTDFPEDAILVTEDLSPSETASLDRSRVRGFCTVTGGKTSHVAILARSLQIPAVTGIDRQALAVGDGTLAILDGSAGSLRIAPDAEQVEQARLAKARDEQRHREEIAAAGELAVTADGQRVEVVANIGGPADAEEAVRFGAEGVGLLRSEFLFMDRAEPPSEDEQYEAYARIAAALGTTRPLVIRTLDVGGDKPLPYLPLAREDNPFLGVRGIRLAAQYPDIIRQQLRAILRAAARGRVHVMFPMIATLEDWRVARGLLEEERLRLHAPAIPAGIMIEVPSAAVVADVFAREADFFSVGTNDLTQYVLAVDRGHPTLARGSDSLHPAVLRLIEMAARAAHAHGRWIGVCGDLASEALAVPILVGLGVDELSVSGPAVPSVKARVRAYTVEECRGLATRALAAASAAEVRAISGSAGKSV